MGSGEVVAEAGGDALEGFAGVEELGVADSVAALVGELGEEVGVFLPVSDGAAAYPAFDGCAGYGGCYFT